jgi:hypothetical protein
VIDYKLKVPRRRAAVARIQFENQLRHVAPIIADAVERDAAEWERNHPAVRTCLFCHRRHRNPRLVWEVRDGRRVRRWASLKCLARKFGPETLAASATGMMVLEVHR